MDERRKLPRKYLVIYSRVFNRVNGAVLGYLSDLTSEGFMLIGETSLPDDSILSLRVDLPENTLFTVKHLDISAKVIWCKPDIDPAFVNLGFNFIDLTPEDMAIIKNMVEIYEFKRDYESYPPSISELENKILKD